MPRRWLVRIAAAGVAGGLLLLAGARPLAHAWERWERAQWHAKVLKAFAQLQGSDVPPILDADEGRMRGEVEEDDATIRRLYTQAYYGATTPDVAEQLFRAAAAERAALTTPRRGYLPNAVVTGQSWVNLGPVDARIQVNGQTYAGIDSGRAATIRVDPRDPNVVYVASAWGGVWKTYDFQSAQPHWIPITDTVGSGAVGAFDLDPNAPDTLFLGLGDALDNSLAGGAVYKSTDGGSSWTLLTPRLSATYPASAGGRTESAVAIRDLAIDRNDGNKILVATDVGLFRSVDGGATWALASLPNDTAGTVTYESATWTIQYLGAANGQSAWVVSGVDACLTNMAPPGFGQDEPPNAPAPQPTCVRGTLGEIWRSTDSGATWTSLRAAGKLPTAASLGGTEYARMALAAGPATNPDTTVVYAQVANADDANSLQLAIFKSTDGGKTFTTKTLGTASAGVLTNPESNYCSDMNVAHDQAWYNLAIAVDPANANDVLLGGNYCGVRSTNGGTTWQNVSHWLPPAASITLPYVHADWHAVTVASVGGSTYAFAGTDGGFFVSSDLFTATAPSWTFVDNRGLTTHLFYGIASGDPTAGDDQVVWGGLQDNGTRFRDLDPNKGSPTGFNQVIGGDGIGTALVRSGGQTVYWASLPSQRMLCTGDPVTTCSQGTGWGKGPTLSTNVDPEPFMMRYATIDPDTTGSLLTSTTYRIWKLSATGTTKTPLTAAMPTTPNATPPLGGVVRNVVASPFNHANCAGGKACLLYGAALSGGKFVVLTDEAGTITQNIASARIGVGTATNQYLLFTTGMAFPSSAAHFKAGALDGQVYLAASTAPRLADNQTVVPDAIGRLFLTTDGGASYTPFHGNGTSDLPNVPIQTVVFDPSDTTDSTLFVGNDLGVYQSTDMGQTWHRYGVGLPFVRVSQILIAKNAGLMRVGTYGRGLWEIYPNKSAAPGVRGDGDWDRNLAIDFLDLGAMASRLGDTPETATQPYYDWHLDLVGASNSLADDDLTALIGKFGSHP